MGILLSAGRRKLSLVDCTSYEIMRQYNLEQVFTYDPHFSEQGFDVIPIHGYKNPNLLKQFIKILFKGFEGQYPMNLIHRIGRQEHLV